MNSADRLYSFYARAILTEEALDRAGRTTKRVDGVEGNEQIANLVALDVLSDDFVGPAIRMSIVYSAIAAFENSVRELITSTLAEYEGENWWEKCVSKKIRDAAQKRKEEEEKIRWHVQRGENPINYTMLPNLIQIIQQNHDPHFAPFISNVEWAKAIFDSLERSRNVIMHSGYLSDRDIARVGTSIRDWVSQVSV